MAHVQAATAALLTQIPSPVAHGVSKQKPPIIYLIRHGEKLEDPTKKPSKIPVEDVPLNANQVLETAPGLPLQRSSDVNWALGLDQNGIDRAYRLPSVLNDAAFGKPGTNPFGIRYIVTMQPQPTGDESRPFQTILPLALSLQSFNNHCVIDNSVLRDAVKEAASRINYLIEYNTLGGNILVCWEHHHLANILQCFGFNGSPYYPEMFDAVWEIQPEWDATSSTWEYKTIQWSSQRTSKDVALANDPKTWMSIAETPKPDPSDPSGKIPPNNIITPQLTTVATGNVFPSYKASGASTDVPPKVWVRQSNLQDPMK